MEQNLDSHLRAYTINDAQGGYPMRRLACPVAKSGIETFARLGYHHLRGAFSESQVAKLRDALSGIVKAEGHLMDPRYEGHHGSIYLRWLLTKDARFLALHDEPQIRAWAQAMLGPQIRFDDVDARVVFPTAEDAVAWHIHLRVVPDPVPPFFCHPNSIHILTYLDDIGPDEGALCVLPGSHAQPDLRIPKDNHEDREGQVPIYPKAGDSVLIHGNLWHRSVWSRPSGRHRRLLISGIVPAWLRVEHRAGVHGPHDFLGERLRNAASPEEREAYGEFTWS